MKKIREQFGRWYFIIPLATIFTFMSCTKNGSTVTPNAKLSGIDIFKAIYFGSGKAVSNIPDYAGKINNLAVSVLDQKTLDSAENEVVALVSSKDKNFFNNFAVKMKSGVPATVREALTSVNTIVQAAIEEKYKVSLNIEGINDLVKELKKDKPVNVADYKKAFNAKKEKYKSLIAYTLTAKTQALETTEVANTNTVQVQNFAAVYFFLGVAIAVLLVLVVPAVTDSSANATNGSTDALGSEQTVAAITSGFAGQ